MAADIRKSALQPGRGRSISQSTWDKELLALLTVPLAESSGEKTDGQPYRFRGRPYCRPLMPAVVTERPPWSGLIWTQNCIWSTSYHLSRAFMLVRFRTSGLLELSVFALDFGLVDNFARFDDVFGGDCLQDLTFQSPTAAFMRTGFHFRVLLPKLPSCVRVCRGFHRPGCLSAWDPF
jgi:hypothetical protein